MSSSVTRDLILLVVSIILFPLALVVGTALLVWVIRATIGAVVTVLYTGKHRREAEMFDRPAEVITAVIATLVGGWQIIVGLLDDGFQFSDLSDPELTGFLTVVIGYVAALVTWYIARKQRANQLGSAPDGAVTPGP